MVQVVTNACTMTVMVAATIIIIVVALFTCNIELQQTVAERITFNAEPIGFTCLIIGLSLCFLTCCDLLWRGAGGKYKTA